MKLAICLIVAVSLPAVAHATAGTCAFPPTVDELRIADTLNERAEKLTRRGATQEEKDLIAHLRAAANDVAKATESELAPPTIKVEHAPVRLSIHLASPPPTRLRLSFDDTSGRHVEVEWDPAVSSDLTRTVTLAADTWRVVAAAEPSTYSQSSGLVVIQARFGRLVPTKKSDGQEPPSATMDATYVAVVASLAAGGTADGISLDVWSRPRLTFQCGAAYPTMESATFAEPAGGAASSSAAGRGMTSTVPSFVTDTLSILAEIAFERARAGAMSALKRRLVDPFCVDDGRITLARLGLGTSDELALPRTCDLLTSLRLGDILSSGRPLLIALRDDLRFTIAPAAIEIVVGNGAAAPVLQSVIAVVNAALDGGGLDVLESQVVVGAAGDFERLAPVLVPDVQRALLEAACPKKTPCSAEIEKALRERLQTPLGRWTEQALLEPLKAALEGDPRARSVVAHACQARLAVATIKQCQRDRCSAADIEGMLTRPEEYFRVDDKLPLSLCWPDGVHYRAVPSDLVEIRQLVVEGLRLVAPVVDATSSRERAKAAVRVLVGLIHRWHAGSERASCRCIDAFAEVAIALIDEDYGTALSRFVRFAQELASQPLPRQLTKVAQLIGAVASYAAVYRDTKDDDPKAAREVRKEALAALIDSATDRADRGGDAIVSIGSNVGLSATWTNQFNREDSDGDRFEPNLRVPLGFAIDWPSGEGLALHGGLQLADLGQFVRRDEDGTLDDVEWADFVSPGIELGAALGFLAPSVNVVVHAAYAPSLDAPDGASDGVWRYGISLGYYVPFFDLN